MYFLTINAGSSSIKFCLFDTETMVQVTTGSLSGIGFESATFKVTGHQEQVSHQLAAKDHLAAIQIVLDWVAENISMGKITAVGHRIVHGGPNHYESCVINDEVMDQLRATIPLDPLHLPTELELIEHIGKVLPQLPQIACFDTAFFEDLPAPSRLFPLPRYLEAEGIRRYGFHGLSYTYLLEEFGRLAGQTAAKGKIVFAHLGNGASLAAVSGGKPIDTSMGLTPTGGVPMSTRSGDLDPGAMIYIGRQAGLTLDDLDHMLNFESGLLGLSETTADMEKLLEIEASDQRAKDAVDIFCYNVRKYIGAYAAALGGLNSLIFSGGIGEASAAIRERICNGLEFLGIQIDAGRNLANDELISGNDSLVGVHVIATNESVTIARDMQNLVGDKVN